MSESLRKNRCAAPSSRLSEAAFQRLVRTLTAEQLRTFPFERLPEAIPIEMVSWEDDPAKRQVLEDLALSVSAEELRVGIEASNSLDDQARAALETAEAATSHGVEQLEAFGSEDQLQATERPHSANELARELSVHFGQLYRATAVLNQASNIPPVIAARVSRARHNAQTVLAKIEPTLGRYYAGEIRLARDEMYAKEQQWKQDSQKLRELDEQIKLVREQTREQDNTVGGLFRRRVKGERSADLESRLRGLIDERNAFETFVSEEDLVGWLDTLVDASLFMTGKAWQSRSQRARLLLYRLLRIYCQQQEEAARQAAALQRTEDRAKSAVAHYLASEEFVLRYFGRKRHAVTAWLSGAAQEKLAQFDEVRAEIIKGSKDSG